MSALIEIVKYWLPPEGVAVMVLALLVHIAIFLNVITPELIVAPEGGVSNRSYWILKLFVAPLVDESFP